MTPAPGHLSLRTPAPLVRLLLVLSATTGMVDAASILGMDRVFAANMTGNVVFTAFAAAGAPGFALAPCLVALGAFVAGAAAAGRIARGRGSTARLSHWLVRAAALESTLLILAGLLALWLASADALAGRLLLAPLALTAGAMGFRNAVVRQLKVPDLSTTVLTLTITGLASDWQAAPGEGGNQRVRLGAVAMIFAGAAAGAALVMAAGVGVTLIATGMLVLAATLVFVRHPQMSEV